MLVSYNFSGKMFVTKFFVTVLFCVAHGKDAKDVPRFAGEGSNATVVEGRDAILTCTVENLNNYKVAWLRVDTQTILTIGPHVITKNHRVGVSRSDSQTWSLTLRDVRPSDAGRYMCQINTEPMITQTHYLQIFVPPDIVDSNSSSEVMIREGDNVTLHCAASGTPQPTILWRREDSGLLHVQGKSVVKWNGEWLNMTSVGRQMNGAFLCIATNGVPPSVSKRIILHVLCKPTVRMTQKMVGVYIGDSVILQCIIEANPPPIVYWTHIDAIKLLNGSKYQASITSQGYKHTAALKVNNVSREDIGSYRCHAENSLGAQNDNIVLYTLATTTTTTISTTYETTSVDTSTTSVQPHEQLGTSEEHYDKGSLEEDSYVVVLSQHQMQSPDHTPSS